MTTSPSAKIDRHYVSRRPATSASRRPPRSSATHTYINLGLPGNGGTWFLPRLVGLGDVVDAARAHELGLVNRVVEPKQLIGEATELATRKSWRAVQASKQSLRASWNVYLAATLSADCWESTNGTLMVGITRSIGNGRPTVVAGAAGVLLALLTACGSTPPVEASAQVNAPTADRPTTASAQPASAPTSEPVRCRLDDLAAQVEQAGPAGNDHVVTISWTDTSSTPCTMSGFGGIDLHGPPDPMGPVYSLPRAEANTPLPATTLAPNTQATTRLFWLPSSEPGGWTPDQIVITPPDETRSAVLPWPRIADNTVLRQDGATHPGTYFYPVTAAQ